MRKGSRSSAESAKRAKTASHRPSVVTKGGPAILTALSKPARHHRHASARRRSLSGLESQLRKSWSEFEHSKRMSTSSIETSKRQELLDVEGGRSAGRNSLAQDSVYSKMPPDFVFEPNQDAKRRLLQMVVAATVCFAMLLICIIAYVFISTEKTVGYCVSSSCMEHAKLLLSSMNTSADPCGNFYAFVCGGWKRQFPELSVLDKMNEDARKSQIMELNADMFRVGGASQLFHQCYEPTKAHVASNIEALLQFMDVVDLVWPAKDVNYSISHPLEVMLYMAAKYDVNFQFHLDVAVSKVIGTVLIFRRRYHGVVWEHRYRNPMNLEEYAMVIRDHMYTLGLKNVQYDAALLRKLETFFVEATLYENGKAEQLWLAITDLDSKTPSIKEVQWNLLLNRQHTITLQRTWNPKDWVVLEDSLILTKLDELFRTFPESHILMGIAWMFIQSHLWVAAGKPDLIFRDNFEEKVQLACLEYVNSLFGLLASAEHLARSYPTDAVRNGVHKFLRSLRTEFVSTLKGTAWIDPESAEKAERKIKNTDLNVLPSEHFFVALQRAGLYGTFPDINASAFVESWLITAESYQKLQNHARFYDLYQKRRTFHGQPYWYAYLRNSVDAATAALDPPLFYTGGTFAMNYGGSGVLLAKEITKAIDPLGTTVNDYGEHVAWWGKTHSAEYNSRLNCELNQAGGQKAMMGVFPSIPALEVSFSAYKAAVRKEGTNAHSVEDLRLRGLEEYSDDQLFFMTYCYALCSREADASSQRECNVPLRHFSHFADAFGCPGGSPMNAISKCTFFN
ncbi:hypothetical protein HPB50_017890 [Hyalomma asiaticum]|uniref:Uncharacterized protein n=1 Tax=Hyalomma asiaticum TaxID=266040 RepID=A0ACB7T5W9_HYAAI|nr:hypothetical protein HPB50_017890 [Hyalomma asiaticum]